MKKISFLFLASFLILCGPAYANNYLLTFGSRLAFAPGYWFDCYLAGLVTSGLISRLCLSDRNTGRVLLSCLSFPALTASFLSLVLIFFKINLGFFIVPNVICILYIFTMFFLGASKDNWAKFDSSPILRLIKKYASFGFLEPAVVREVHDNLGGGSHGSARWGVFHDAIKNGHVQPPEPAFVLGWLDKGDSDLDGRFRFMGHVVTCAPTGSGKGIGSVIPNLLEYPGSCLVLDIKGETYAVTARRRRELGFLAAKIDPFGVAGGPSLRYNPLDPINLGNEDCIAQSISLAGNMVMREKAGEMGHWDESAQNLIQGLILHVKTTGSPNLGEVRRLLTTSQDELDGVLAAMSVADEAFGIIARAANSIVSKPEKERASIISTAQRHTAFLDDPRIANALSTSDFDLQALKSELISCYIILPPAKLEQNTRFVRVLIGSALEGITGTSQKPPCNVAFFLDEFAQLGYMPQIEGAISLMRGYGVSFLLYVQDLSQLKSVYGKWQSFLANSAKVFFGVSDIDTAKYVSQSLGVRTIQQQSASVSSKVGIFSDSEDSKSDSVSETGRALLTPDEVMRLGPKRPLVLISGEPPYVLGRLNYLVDGPYRGRFDGNPYHA